MERYAVNPISISHQREVIVDPSFSSKLKGGGASPELQLFFCSGLSPAPWTSVGQSQDSPSTQDWPEY